MAFQSTLKTEGRLYPAFLCSSLRARTNLVLIDPMAELIAGSKLSEEAIIKQFDVSPDIPDGGDKAAEREAIMVRALCARLGITGDELEV